MFIGILQGAIFAALLLIRYFKLKKSADFWLAALLALLCLSLITPFIGFANVYDRNQWLTYFPFGIAYASSACIWFYVLTLTNAERFFRRRDWLLFLPSIVYLIFRFTLFAQSLEVKDWFSNNYDQPYVTPFITITKFVWDSALLYFAIRHYRQYRAWLDENYSDTEKIKFDWLRNFLYLFTLVFVLGTIFDFTGAFFFPLSYIQYFYFEFVLALVTYYLAIAGYLRSETITVNFTEAESERLEAAAEEKQTLLPETELTALKAKLRGLMEAEKPFLDSQLTLANLAKRLGVNATVLSRTINSGFDKNFNDFVNEYRIAEVQNRLRNGDAGTENLLGIAFDSGFNSKATFNRAFKKFAGVAPKEFARKC